MTLDPVTRAACAEALASATAETLREDAAAHINVANALNATRWPNGVGPNDALAAAHRRAAALALAAAEMQERGERSCVGCRPTWRIMDEGDAAWSIDAPQTTLPAALAHLIREGA